MTWQEALVIYGLILSGCLVGGVAIGTSMALIGIVGVTLISGTQLWQSLGEIVWNTTNTFTLVSIPLFVLMGEIILRSGIASRFYNGIGRLLGRVPGGLAHTNILGCAVFSALAGSSVATAMTVGTVALPEMRARGYNDRLILGTLTGGGCLGILIPPSIPLIVYASMVQESVISLFMAGIIPGILLVVAFMVYVMVRVALDRSLVPAHEPVANARDAVRGLLDTVPVAVLILSILGGMYFGVVTPTEAAGFGCLLALLIGLMYRQLTVESMKTALRNAVMTSASVMFITITAQILSFAVVSSGIGRGVADLLSGSGLSPFVFFCLLFLLYLVIGMFIDGLSMLLLTVPVLYPGMMAMGFDSVWVGIILVIFIELGALTPPMGLNLMAIKSISPDTGLGEIGWASMPFALIIILFGFFLYAFPGVVLYLPMAMRAG